MTRFEAEYQQLNEAQQAAVDTIYGPLLALAGPGTGKTQLLAMRVANILRYGDVLPRNILCITFTESAQIAMRERLAGLIGNDAYKVAIHTFHSFGVEVMNQHPEYFFRGARFAPADGVLQIEILESILQQLPLDNPLASQMNDQLVYLRSAHQAIGYLKQAGLRAADLRGVLEANERAIERLEPQLQEVFGTGRLQKSDISAVEHLVESMTEDAGGEKLPEPFRPFGVVLQGSLQTALREAAEMGKTTPLTAWRNQWMEKNADNQFVFKDHSRNQRLRALADVYEQYQQELTRRARYDFSDMVLYVLSVIETTPQLRYQLQEQYQFLLVDEFQDTNDGQLRLLRHIADNPVHEGNPDLMVVGDDDQAVYKFQGAEANNVLHFQDAYPGARVITLTQNYRSRQDILDYAYSIIRRGEARLENVLEGVDKQLHANRSVLEGDTSCWQLSSAEEEYAWIAQTVSQLIVQGTQASSIAIIGRQHMQLEALMPHLRNAGVPVAYERRRNILEEPHIQQLLDMAHFLRALADGRHDEANALLAHVLKFPFWGIEAAELWRISREAHEQRRWWRDVITETGSRRAKQAVNVLEECAKTAESQPLEYTLDQLIGVRKAGKHRSPYREYYFSRYQFEENRGEYVAFLSALRLLRTKLRQYRQQETIYVRDLIDMVHIYQANNMQLVDETPFVSSDNAVQVMTAHKAKGLEFETVYLINCQESVWASQSGRQQIRFPHNLPITPPGDEFDDQLRLFYVAMTRAQSNLYLSGYTHDNQGKPSPLVPFVDHDDFRLVGTQPDPAYVLETAWQSYDPLPTSADAAAVLQPVLEQYQLNVTHLLKFLDVIRGGPHTFLLESLLRFPQAPAPAAAYGTAVHATLRDVYHQLQTGVYSDIETSLDLFEHHLEDQRLRGHDHNKYLQQGRRELQAYLQANLPSFYPDHLVEVDFRNQGVMVGDARLSGQIDKLVLNDQQSTCQVHDFKTGRPLAGWNRNSGSEGEKSWKYRRQLTFYKLLIEHSRSWSGYTVEKGILEFIKSREDSTHLLEYAIEDEEVERLQALIQVVWSHIQRLDFPDTSHYEANLKGIRCFEEDLLQAS